jgi:hypothetical protein
MDNKLPSFPRNPATDARWMWAGLRYSDLTSEPHRNCAGQLAVNRTGETPGESENFALLGPWGGLSG